MSTTDGTKLSDLKLGQTAIIAAVGGEPSFRRRLLELGLLPGTRVTLEHIAPFGDPWVLRLRDGCLSIRRQQAEEIDVQR